MDTLFPPSIPERLAGNPLLHVYAIACTCVPVSCHRRVCVKPLMRCVPEHVLCCSPTSGDGSSLLYYLSLLCFVNERLGFFTKA